ncbi:MAG: hypothetical protein ABI992_12155, partial [Chthoniobacterales bacterium]
GGIRFESERIMLRQSPRKIGGNAAVVLRKRTARGTRVVVVSLLFLGLAGCARKSGEAVVLEKEHIAVAENSSTPSAEHGASQVIPTPSPESRAPEEAETPRELKPGEIVVGGYVMDEKVRGTSKDPRASLDEQWLVRVELTNGGRQIEIPAARKQYDKVKPGDHVQVTYREGKYTGTIWSAEID